MREMIPSPSTMFQHQPGIRIVPTRMEKDKPCDMKLQVNNIQYIMVNNIKNRNYLFWAPTSELLIYPVCCLVE